MGSFRGHLLPGLIFTLLSVWTLINIWRKYFRGFSKRNRPFQSQPLYSPVCRGVNIQALPLVSYLSVGILGELYLDASFRGAPIKMKNIQHTIMYLFYTMFAFIELCKIRLKKRLPIVDEISYVSFALANFVEGMLFSFHLMGRDAIDTAVHIFLVYTSFASAFITILEMLFRNHVLAPLGRFLFTLLQGTWFIQAGFILYSPFKGSTPWDPENHTHVMLVACLFAVHLGGVFLFMIISGCIICCCARREKANLDDEEMAVKRLQN